jgi:hypothetical protein
LSEADNVARDLAARLSGRRLKEVVREEHQWAFSFEEDVSIAVWGLWRIVAEGRNCLCSEDDGHQFGLPAPIDGAAEAWDYLRDKAVETVSLRTTGDLTFSFAGSIALEVIQNSSGYEAWQLVSPAFQVICQGGGQLAIWKLPLAK